MNPTPANHLKTGTTGLTKDIAPPTARAARTLPSLIDLIVCGQILSASGETSTSTSWEQPRTALHPATASGQDRTGDPHAVQAALQGRYGNHPDEIRARPGETGVRRGDESAGTRRSIS